MTLERSTIAAVSHLALGFTAAAWMLSIVVTVTAADRAYTYCKRRLAWRQRP